jgi:putative oxidoreductase
MAIGILILRLVFGLTLAAHGVQKLFGWFGGPGIAGTAPFLEQLGFRPGRLQAALAGIVEVSGGLLLAAGLCSPLAAAMVISVMVVASVTVHLRNGFFAQKGGYEYNLALAACALALAFTGPGELSVDAVLGIGWSGAAWGITALALGLAGAGLQLLTRSWRSPAQVSAHEPA